MTTNIHENGALRRLLKLVLEASAVAVAIQYAAPWEQGVTPQSSAEKRKDANCGPYEAVYFPA